MMLVDRADYFESIVRRDGFAGEVSGMGLDELKPLHAYLTDKVLAIESQLATRGGRGTQWRRSAVGALSLTARQRRYVADRIKDLNVSRSGRGRGFRGLVSEGA